MTDFTSDKRDMVIELVNKQKKAKLQWISTITQVSIENLAANAEEMGFQIEDDFILLPSESKEQKVKVLVKDKREQILTIIVRNRYYRYNPAHSAHVTFDTIRKGILVSRHRARQIEWLIDQFAEIRYVIISLHGEVIDADEHKAKIILERMKNSLRNYPDALIRTFVPIKKYLEFQIIPFLYDAEKALSSQLLELASKEDIRINNLAFSTIEQNITEKRVDRKGVIKELSYLHSDGTTITYKAHQIQKLYYQYMQAYEKNFREQFYNHQNFITNIVRNVQRK